MNITKKQKMPKLKGKKNLNEIMIKIEKRSLKPKWVQISGGDDKLMAFDLQLFKGVKHKIVKHHDNHFLFLVDKDDFKRKGYKFL